MPELAGKAGHDIVTSSGDTLLGADDKAGVAEIMAAVAHLAAHPELPRPTLRVGFTPDEEIGEGATLFDVERFGARCAYTIDGSDARRAAGRDVHRRRGDRHDPRRRRPPGLRDRQAGQRGAPGRPVLAALPAELAPEATSGREGFMHPYEVAGDGRPRRSSA